ncbi:MAG: hypothetical protein KatS3mg068_0386 [Candidatus Sericytochromatia bacterium]|nr:MAG: hypothetical protein KatS3mg068_0386 [Candidatus Sericytochromatia bacterium]
MLKKNNNLKVGVTFTIFFLILAFSIIWLSQFRFTKNTYKLQGIFDNVGGLIAGSKVYYLGVSVGKVIAVNPEYNKVIVDMEINSNIKIPKNVRLTITSKGIVGDKCIEFFKGIDQKLSDDYYKADEIIKGFSPVSVDDVIAETRNTLLKAQDLITNKQIQDDIIKTIKNIQNFSSNISETSNQLSKVSSNIDILSKSAKELIDGSNLAIKELNNFISQINIITLDNKKEIAKIIENVGKISYFLAQTTKNINDLITDNTNQKDVKISMNSLKNTTKNIEEISKSVERLIYQLDKISSDIRDITGDESFKKNLKDIIANTKNISNIISNPIITQGNNNKTKNNETLNAEFRSEILPRLVHQFKENVNPTFDFVANFNMLVNTGFEKLPFIQLGIEEIGPKNQFNLQAGFYPFENFRIRLGLIKGRLGGGTNYFLKNTNTEIIGELYDISSPFIRIGILQNIYKDYGLTFYWNNEILKNINEFNLGFQMAT